MIKELWEILFEGDNGSFDDKHIQVTKRKDVNQYDIEYGQMYGAPNLSFAKLMELSKLFGTEEIDVDDYSSEGCESCDYGSDYGHTIQLKNPTLNTDNLDKILMIEFDFKKMKETKLC